MPYVKIYLVYNLKYYSCNSYILNKSVNSFNKKQCYTYRRNGRKLKLTEIISFPKENKEKGIGKQNTDKSKKEKGKGDR